MHRSRLLFRLSLLVPLLSQLCYAATIQVPGDQSSIQGAIGMASSGDTILVAPGVYYERIDYLGKNLVVAGHFVNSGDTAHISQTIIDGDTSQSAVVNDTGTVVRFVNGEDSTAKLTGFTIRNGIGANGRGGGILSDRASPADPYPSPRISFCRILNNQGSGVYGSSGMLISNCDIRQNEPYGYEGSGGRLEYCDLDSNSSGGILASSIGTEISAAYCNFRSENYGVTYTGSDPQSFSAYGCVFESNGTALAHPWATVRACNFLKNDQGARIGPGAKLHAEFARLRTDIVIDSCVFVSNSTALTILNMTFTVSHCDFEDNDVALGVQVDVGVHLTECSFVGNGYAFHASEPNIIYTNISNCEFIENEVGTLHYAGNLTCDNSLFLRNSGEPLLPSFNSPGSGISKYTFRNASFIDNVITPGPLIEAYGDTLELNSCLFVGNTCDEIATSWLDFNNTDSAVVAALCTDIFGNSGLEWDGFLLDQEAVNGNFTANPLFCDPATDNYGIAEESPCAPANNSCGVLVGSKPVSCMGQPTVTSIDLQEQADLFHVIDHTPTLLWTFDNPVAGGQTEFEVEVGTDQNWDIAEMWDPPPSQSDETKADYAGAPLIDGSTYWLRLRLMNNLLWSEWYETSFHMNSVPEVPTNLLPASGTIVNSTLPTLSVLRPPDSDGDSLQIEFHIADSESVEVSSYSVSAAADTVSLQVAQPLSENATYYWQARASDYYESSSFGEQWSFYVNADESAPAAFDLLAPPNSVTPALPTNSPGLLWLAAVDFDPLDSINYVSMLAADSLLDSVFQADSTTDTTLAVPSALAWGQQCWWRVKAVDKTGLETWSTSLFTFKTMIPGDADGDGEISISDATYLINYIFGGGLAADPPEAADADCNGTISIGDAVYLINFVFGDGPEPCFLPAL